MLNSDLVDWQSEDLSYLSSRTSYRRYLWERISAAQVIGIEQIDQARGGADARIHYNGLRQLDGILSQDTAPARRHGMARFVQKTKVLTSLSSRSSLASPLLPLQTV